MVGAGRWLSIGLFLLLNLVAVAAACAQASNVALASAGAVASASSTYSGSYPVNSLNNNERTGAGWGAGGGWLDGTPGSFPDWVQIQFNGSQTIDRVVVYMVQDNFQQPVEPSDSLTFNDWGATDFTVEGWNGSGWTLLGTVTGNNLVKRTVSFGPFTTDRIRINILGGRSPWSLLTEVEAWSVAAAAAQGTSNVALASAGGMASASSTYSGSYPVNSLNNNERTGVGWGAGGGWLDGTPGNFPDWVQIQFNGSKTIDRVVVYMVQDNFQQPVEPSDSLTFNDWGATDFTVEGWNGSGWTLLGTVTGNNLVKRTVSFGPFTTDRIRINVLGGRSPWSLLTEVEAWTPTSSSGAPPAPVPPSAALTVQMTDAAVFVGDLDGPTWELANRPMLVPWVNPGGDWRDSANVAQGNAHYAVSADIDYSYYSTRDVTLPVTALVSRLLSNNTGIYLLNTKGEVKIASRSHAMLPGPRLHIVTTTGIFDPPCIVDTWVSPSTNQPMGAQDTFEFPAIIKFDLTGVTGTVTSATLSLSVYLLYAVPAQITADYLDPPSLNLTASGSVVGNRVEGIAATVAQDSALASHPSVLIYDNLISKDYIFSNFQGIAGAPPTIADNLQIIDWPQYGLKAARVWSITTNQRLISWHHWAEPKQNPPKPWQRDFGDGYTHLFFRYLMEIGTDVKAGMTELGMKLPGLAGTYDFSNSGAVTLPQPPNDGTWEMRLWHAGVSPRANPDIYGLATYFYGVDHPTSQFSGNGQVRFTKGFLKAGRVYSIEQEIKLNTLTNGVANPDGVERVWIDGVLMYENTGMRIRGYDNVRIQSIPWMNIYHGGLGFPSAPFHYDVGGLVVSTEYIGPPKLVGSGSQ